LFCAEIMSTYLMQLSHFLQDLDKQATMCAAKVDALKPTVNSMASTITQMKIRAFIQLKNRAGTCQTSDHRPRHATFAQTVELHMIRYGICLFADSLKSWKELVNNSSRSPLQNFPAVH